MAGPESGGAPDLERVRDGVLLVERQADATRPGGLGTAFYIGDGLAVTAAHVAGGRTSNLTLFDSSGRRLVAVLEAIDRDADLAVLRVRSAPVGLAGEAM